METTTITTVTKMLESLPDAAQDRVVEHLREYIENLRDEMKWDQSFKNNSSKLIEAAHQARKEIAEGRTRAMTPLEPNKSYELATPYDSFGAAEILLKEFSN